MKKVLVVMLGIMTLLLMSGCSRKNLSTSKIVDVLTKDGYTVNDVTAIINDSTVKVAKAPNNGKYQFEYYVFKTEKAAKIAYNSNKDNFKKAKSNSSKEKEVKEDDYTKYTVESSDTYNVIIRKEKSVIYASVSINYKGSLNDELSKIGF